MISVDTIVHGGIVVTMNAKEEIVADGAVAVREGIGRASCRERV